jgi:hypothetical protein
VLVLLLLLPVSPGSQTGHVCCMGGSAWLDAFCALLLLFLLLVPLLLLLWGPQLAWLCMMLPVLCTPVAAGHTCCELLCVHRSGHNRGCLH